MQDENGRATGRKPIQNVVLINPPIRPEEVYGKKNMEWAALSVPTGLCSIAAVLRETNFTVSIIDAEALKTNIEETANLVVEKKPDIIGIACKTLWVENAHTLARRLKERLPHILIVAGGNHITALPERSLAEYPCFDLLVIGEGEYTFLELIQSLNTNGYLHSVKGIAFRETGRVVITEKRERIVDLDDLPFPAYDLLPIDVKEYQASLFQVDAIPAIEIIFSRGCPGRCAFCDRKVFGNRITWHSPRYIVSLIEKLYREYGVRGLMFNDDNLFVNKRHLEEILELLMEKNIRIKFTCAGRVDSVDLDILQKAKKAGCTRVMYGVESGSRKILDLMNKRIDGDKIRTALHLTHKAGIKSTVFIIIGYPGETIDTLNETVALLKELPIDDVSPFYFTPLPGSDIYADIPKYGQFTEDWGKMNSLDQIVFIPYGVTKEILQEYYAKIIDAVYLKWRQLFTFYRKIPTFGHLKAYCRALSHK